MARPPRIELVGVPLHVIQRGVSRSTCFFNDIDRRFYLNCLAKYGGLRDCAIHAYVLMTNHVHLLVTPRRKGAVARLMQDIGRSYVRTINSVHGRSGTLWDGRFKSSLVDSDRYLLACHRYIELNPVRAGMVQHPKDYPWSSYSHYAKRNDNVLLTDHDGYRALGTDTRSRAAAFEGLMHEPLTTDIVKEIRDAANACAAIGSKAFLERMAELAGRDVRIPVRGRPRNESPRNYQ